MIKYSHTVAIISLLVALSHQSFGQLAVIKKNVIDMSSGFPTALNSPASPEDHGCRRAHQGLFNEIVFISETSHYDYPSSQEAVGNSSVPSQLTSNQSQVEFYNPDYKPIIYGFDPITKEPLGTFWTLSENLIPLDRLNKEALATIPNPAYGESIVLIAPWQTSENEFFSIGTRFVWNPQESDLQEDGSLQVYRVIYYDFISHQCKEGLIPVEKAMMELSDDPSFTASQCKDIASIRRELFIVLLMYAIENAAQDIPDGVIPFVWGGSSFIKPYSQQKFYEQDGVWHRDGDNNPYTGYDSSELVWRMAKIAGIRFPWKTTKAMRDYLKPLEKDGVLQQGDLIHIPGGVMIVADREKNTLIRASSYRYGLGCVHVSSVANRFDGIKTLDELIDVYRAGKTVRLNDRHGDVMDEEYELTLLKLIA